MSAEINLDDEDEAALERAWKKLDASGALAEALKKTGKGPADAEGAGKPKSGEG